MTMILGVLRRCCLRDGVSVVMCTTLSAVIGQWRVSTFSRLIEALADFLKSVRLAHDCRNNLSLS